MYSQFMMHGQKNIKLKNINVVSFKEVLIYVRRHGKLLHVLMSGKIQILSVF